MNNKTELKNQVEKLKKELLELELQIEKSDQIDLFKIDTYDKVCKALNKDKETCPYRVIKDIEKLFNQGWKPNWSNSEYKWYPYFSFGSFGGFSFRSSGYCCSGFTGECAYYKDKETSNYIGKTFLQEYKNLRDNN